MVQPDFDDGGVFGDVYEDGSGLDDTGGLGDSVFGKRGPKMFNFELLFLHGFSSKNREILHKAVLTPQEYEDYFF